MERAEKSGGSEEPPLDVACVTGYCLAYHSLKKRCRYFLRRVKNPSNRTLGTEKRNFFTKCLWNVRNIIGLTSKENLIKRISSSLDVKSFYRHGF